jgi:hypothetical protein
MLSLRQRQWSAWAEGSVDDAVQVAQTAMQSFAEVPFLGATTSDKRSAETPHSSQRPSLRADSSEIIGVVLNVGLGL